MHNGDEHNHVTCQRKKPRGSKVNAKHVKSVWGDKHTKGISLQKLIDNYNHWMLGTDLVDQFIAYYCLKLWCCCTWMPIMFHCLGALRTY